MNTDVYVPIDVINQQAIDELLERRIEQARIAMTATTDMQARRDACEEMRWLISQRSPQRVAQMEEEQGLTK